MQPGNRAEQTDWKARLEALEPLPGELPDMERFWEMLETRLPARNSIMILSRYRWVAAACVIAAIALCALPSRIDNGGRPAKRQYISARSVPEAPASVARDIVKAQKKKAVPGKIMARFIAPVHHLPAIAHLTVSPAADLLTNNDTMMAADNKNVVVIPRRLKVVRINELNDDSSLPGYLTGRKDPLLIPGPTASNHPVRKEPLPAHRTDNLFKINLQKN